MLEDLGQNMTDKEKLVVLAEQRRVILEER